MPVPGPVPAPRVQKTLAMPDRTDQLSLDWICDRSTYDCQSSGRKRGLSKWQCLLLTSVAIAEILLHLLRSLGRCGAGNWCAGVVAAL